MMESVVLSALCGAAFIGGAVAVILAVAAIVTFKDKSAREEYREMWLKQIEKSSQQIDVLAEICATMQAYVVEQRGK